MDWGIKFCEFWVVGLLGCWLCEYHIGHFSKSKIHEYSAVGNEKARISAHSLGILMIEL